MARKKNSQTEEDKSIKREPFTRQLRVALTAEEAATLSTKSEELFEQADVAKEVLSEETKQRKAAIKRMTQDARALLKDSADRATNRDVACERVYDYRADMVREVRKDTGEVIGERAMTDDERQRELPYDLPPGGGDLEEEFA